MAILIIVESPTKAKAIQSYAWPEHQVKSSFGHVRDLPAKDLGVDVDAGFKPHYTITNRKAIQTLRKALESADTVILTSDPEREGEAIAWHLAETFKKELRGKKVSREVFHEITPAAVRAGLADTRPVDMDSPARHLLNPPIPCLYTGSGMEKQKCLNAIWSRWLQ